MLRRFTTLVLSRTGRGEAMKKNAVRCLLAAMLLAVVTSTLWALPAPQSKSPIISSATITTSTTPQQITIQGTNFGTSTPLVSMDGFSLQVTSNLDTTVVAQLPSMETNGVDVPKFVPW